ncbi:MAG: hypothetical protein JW759_04430 [Candidatus Coatesbacteria bacterium]|nr:hypothetical protein [Candidatus Coatesbacteria bacterium]
MPNPCYKLVTDPADMFQGDILTGCPCALLSEIPSDDILTRGYGTCPADIAVYDAIILSQSCDLQPRKEGKKKGEDRIDNVVFCPIYPLEAFEKKHGPDLCKKVTAGKVIGLYSLRKTPLNSIFKGDRLVANFHNTFSLPIEVVRQLILRKGRRLRLRSPYRESLSQAFGRFFMRVALPGDEDGPGA